MSKKMLFILALSCLLIAVVLKVDWTQFLTKNSTKYASVVQVNESVIIYENNYILRIFLGDRPKPKEIAKRSFFPQALFLRLRTQNSTKIYKHSYHKITWRTFRSELLPVSDGLPEVFLFRKELLGQKGSELIVLLI